MHVDECCATIFTENPKIKMKQKGIFEKLLFIITHPEIKIPEYRFIHTEPDKYPHKVYYNEYNLLKEILKLQDIKVTAH